MYNRYLLLLLFFVSLQKILAAPIDEEAAIRAAGTFFQQKAGITKAFSSPVIQHAEKSGENVCYYILKPESGEGFLILSGDDEIFPVIGFSDESFFDGNPNPAFKAWIEQRKAEIETLLARPAAKAADGTSAAKTAWNSLLASGTRAIIPDNSVQVVVSPLLGNIKWGQNGYYNILCPYDAKNRLYTLVGCVATAMGQIMAYWGWKNNLTIDGKGGIDYIDPSFGLLSTDFSSRSYVLSAMPAKLDASTAGASVQAVARLLADCGKSVRMNYGVTGSGAYLGSIASGLYNYFGFKRSLEYMRSNYGASDWEAKIKAEINALRPVAYGGANVSDEGHAWVVDGYGNYQGKSVFHFNWGWDGALNGYYSLSLNDASLTEPENMYLYDQSAICGIEPGADSYLQLRNVKIEGFQNNSSIGENIYTGQRGGKIKADIEVYNPTSQSITASFYPILEFVNGYVIYSLYKGVSVPAESSQSYSVMLNTVWQQNLGDLNFCMADSYSDGGNEAYFFFGRYEKLIVCRENIPVEEADSEEPANAVAVYGTVNGICIVNSGLIEGGLYSVYTISGNKIAGGILSSGKQTLSGIAPGVYVVELVSEEGRFVHKVAVR